MKWKWRFNPPSVSEKIPDEYKICIYRLVQEALNNAARHSAAKNAKVTVEQTADKILVSVSDDGRGFDPQRVRGLGILGMEERVRRLGGTFHHRLEARERHDAEGGVSATPRLITNDHEFDSSFARR